MDTDDVVPPDEFSPPVAAEVKVLQILYSSNVFRFYCLFLFG